MSCVTSFISAVFPTLPPVRFFCEILLHIRELLTGRRDGPGCNSESHRISQVISQRNSQGGALYLWAHQIMGIRTNPGYKLFVDNCFCWPDGQTPKKLFVAVNGVVPGAAWITGTPKAPNGNWVIEWQRPHLWEGGNADWFISLAIGSFVTVFQISGRVVAAAFFRSTSDLCAANFLNSLGPAGNIYHEGVANILSRPDL